MNTIKTVFALFISSLLVHANEVDEFIKDLESGDKAKRREAARSLSLIGAKAKAAVPALIKGLDDDEEQVFFGLRRHLQKWALTLLRQLQN